MHTPTVPKTILVPVDYSEPSRLALEQAVALARSLRAKLVLLFAWAAPYADLPLSSEHATDEQKTLFDLVRKECEETMVGFIRQIEAQVKDVDLSWYILSGDPGRVILKQASALDVDLIVMGSHGRTGAARWLLGSVTEAVVRHAPCPVLVVPRPHED
jgi:nucleotide-binding universal stress UspA family protein